MDAPPSATEIARSVGEAIRSNDVALRIFGGAAIALEHFWGRAYGTERQTNDVDLLTRRRDLRRSIQLLEQLGAHFDPMSLLKTDGRLVRGKMRGVHLDLFTDPLYANQTIHFDRRLDLEPPFLSAADLLATKLQIETPKNSDTKDIIAIIAANELADRDGAGIISLPRLAELCRRSWTFYHAATTGISRATSKAGECAFVVEGGRPAVSVKMALIAEAFQRKPKPLAWRLRARLGTILPSFDEVDD
jgi:hypothetical protein